MTDRVRFLTWQEVLDQVLSFLPPEWRANFTGKILKRLLVAFALSMEGLYGLLARVLRLSILATSEGRWLRSLVAGLGMTAYGGVAAIAGVRFERWGDSTSPVTIPARTAVQTETGLIFLTQAEAVLPANQFVVVVDAVCTRPGVAGNVAGGQINALKTPLQGIDAVTNPDAAVGGAEPESDALIKRRVPQHLAMLHRATIPATEAAILAQPALFPEVVSFITERRANLPGYVRGVLADASGGDLFRPTSWTASGIPGVWQTTVSTAPQGLIEVGWPCIRFGVLSRDSTGAEVWGPSESALAVSQGSYRWFHDSTTGLLYARALGQDLNGLNLVLYTGVVWRAVQELQQRWIAAGVALDIIVPQAVRVAIALNYALEPGYSASTVEAAIAAAVNGYVGRLLMGAPLELDNLYVALGAVTGAGGILIEIPASNVAIGPGEIVRVGSVTVVRRG
jgi:uncharacterized phage protein gp47/JayE